MSFKFGHIELFVNNPKKSKEFYINILGFKLVSEQANGKFIWLSCGNIEILLREKNNEITVKQYSESKIALVLYTNNLNKDVTSLKNKGLKFEGFDGNENCPTFKDLDDNWWQLVNPNQH